METFSKRFIIEDGKITPELDSFLEQADLIDEADSTPADFSVYIKSFSFNNHYSVHGFDIDELEAVFNMSGDLVSVQIRDDKSKKKAVFTNKSAELNYIKKSVYTRESVYCISINKDLFFAPIDIAGLYKKLTGNDVDFMTQDDIEIERENSLLWSQLSTQLKEDGYV